MKLYYLPGACWFAPHIILHELGKPVQAVTVDLRLADRKPGTLAPAFGDMARNQLMEWLNCVNVSAWPRIVDYVKRIGERPAVKATKTAESGPAK